MMRKYQRQKVPGVRSRLREGVTEGMAIHPIVRFIWDQINHQRASQEDIAQRSGVSASTMRKWRCALTPRGGTGSSSQRPWV